MTRPPPIELVPLAGCSPPPELLETLANRLSAALCARVTMLPPVSLPAAAASEGSALDSNVVVDDLVARSGPGADPAIRWILAVTDAPLVAPGRSFVFGEATLGGGWALVTSAGLGDDRAALLDRLLKESVHELGHLAGLAHCAATRCVMHASASVADIDVKESDFCEECRDRFYRQQAP